MQSADAQQSGASPSPTHRQTMESLNAIDDKEAYALLLRFSHCEWWAIEMLERRPFKDLAQVEETARSLWAQVTDAQWLTAFTGHPLIGDVDHLRRRFDTHAISEQGQVIQTSTAVLEELAELNRDYLDRHGFIFIICATGRSAEEMLAVLKGRIRRSTEQAFAEASREHAAITGLRLRTWLSSHQTSQSRTNGD